MSSMAKNVAYIMELVHENRWLTIHKLTIEEEISFLAKAQDLNMRWTGI
jgi:hypothetical protein